MTQDVLGNEVRPGDVVAIAFYNYLSVLICTRIGSADNLNFTAFNEEALIHIEERWRTLRKPPYNSFINTNRGNRFCLIAPVMLSPANQSLLSRYQQLWQEMRLIKE